MQKHRQKLRPSGNYCSHPAKTWRWLDLGGRGGLGEKWLGFVNLLKVGLKGCADELQGVWPYTWKNRAAIWEHYNLWAQLGVCLKDIGTLMEVVPSNHRVCGNAL